MFDEYAKKLKDIKANVPEVFKKVAGHGAVHFRNEAVKRTDKEGLVDTGAYKRNWEAAAVEFDKETFGVVGYNGMEYASFLEDGYDIKKEHFVPFPDSGEQKKVKHTPLNAEGKVISRAKATGGKDSGGGIQKFMREFRQKYPNAKGFLAKPRRFKGRKIGRMSMAETRYFCIQKLDEMFEKLYTKYQRGFTTPDS
jgi:hypothetical protein